MKITKKSLDAIFGRKGWRKGTPLDATRPNTWHSTRINAALRLVRPGDASDALRAIRPLDVRSCIAALSFSASERGLERPWQGWARIDGGSIVGTDGHTLGVFPCAAPDGYLPPIGFQEIARLAGGIVRLDGEALRWAGGDLLFAPPPSLRCPPWRQYTPSGAPCATIRGTESDRERWLEIFRESPEDNLRITIEGDSCTVLVQARGESVWTRPALPLGSVAESTYRGPLEVGVHAPYMVRALEAMVGAPSIEIRGRLDPVILRDGQRMALVMPVRT